MARKTNQHHDNPHAETQKHQQTRKLNGSGKGYMNFLFDSAYQIVTWVLIGGAIAFLVSFYFKDNWQGVLWSSCILACSIVVMLCLLAQKHFPIFQSSDRNKIAQIELNSNEPKPDTNEQAIKRDDNEPRTSPSKQASENTSQNKQVDSTPVALRFSNLKIAAKTDTTTTIRFSYVYDGSRGEGCSVNVTPLERNGSPIYVGWEGDSTLIPGSQTNMELKLNLPAGKQRQDVAIFKFYA